jgi:hypothetical protein
MRDLVAFIALTVAFAALVTVHVSIVWGLARRQPRWRAAVAFFVVPLAPYWALRDGMSKRATLWIGSVVVYAIARVLASR